MEIRRYLPSKRFSFFVFSIVAAGVLIFAASFIGKGRTLSSAFNAFTNITIGSGATSVGDEDRDADGLKDWEEGVRGTDAGKADTDGDGTSDGEEVRLVRDPNKPGPDDSLVDTESQKFLSELLAQASSTNLTDDLSQTIFARYVEARGKGASGDVQTQAAVVNEAIASAEVSYRGDPYETSDLTVVADSPTAMRTFANGSMQAILRHPDANFMLAMQTFGLGMEGNAAAIGKLRYIGREYRSIAREMAATPVPRSLAEQYLLAVNSFEIAGGSFEDMTYIQEDPIRGVAGLQNYDRMISGGAGVFILLAREVDRAGLLFSANEPGRSWREFIAIANPGISS